MPKDFKGPLFIVGKPRSGTKLLARILGQHPNIAIEVSETQFIPYYLKHPELISDLRKKENFKRFYNSVIDTVYFKSYHTDIIDVEKWYNLCDDYSFYNVLEVLLRYYSNSIDKPNSIWGDKSNNYINHVKLLKRYLPTSKFIHIVRDVRDASLSSYNAWHTNVYRYSQRWFNDISQINHHLKTIPDDDYIEFKYEELITHPEKIVTGCLDMLGLEFIHDLLTFDEPSETVGDAKGMTEIKPNNYQKFKQVFSRNKVLRIEKMTWPLLKKYAYEYEYQGPVKKLSRFMLFYYQSLDVINRFIFDVKNSGLKNILSIIKGNFAHFKK